MQKYTKALVPLVVGTIIGVGGQVGITESMTVVDALTVLVTSFFVYLFPNKA